MIVFWVGVLLEDIQKSVKKRDLAVLLEKLYSVSPLGNDAFVPGNIGMYDFPDGIQGFGKIIEVSEGTTFDVSGVDTLSDMWEVEEFLLVECEVNVEQGWKLFFTSA